MLETLPEVKTKASDAGRGEAGCGAAGWSGAAGVCDSDDGGAAEVRSGMLGALEDRLSPLWERMACHGSTRAGDAMGAEAAMALYRDLLFIEKGTHCPHGRPTLIHLSMAELARRFGRT